MSQMTKGELWKALKEAGVEFDKHYRDYSTAQLQEAYEMLQVPAEPEFNSAGLNDAYQALVNEGPRTLEPSVPVSSQPAEYAGLTQNTHSADDPIRRDPETGFLWYRDEIPKPAYPKPRARRVLKYEDSGARSVTVTNGNYQETFEIPGERKKVSEAKITLPSYQVGLYKDPSLPFRIHVYNGMKGFDLFEVEAFYGGPELVPSTVKRVYVDSALCYDIRSTIQAINSEYRERVLGQPTIQTR